MKIDPELWPKLSKLLDQWLDLPEGLRADWLDSLGPAEADVLPLLRELAARANAGEDLLNTLPRMSQSDASRTGDDTPFASGTLIGAYRLMSELGRGGMGSVWLADRADGTIKRPVALKLPVVSLNNRVLAERFAREREILARLNHPRIARLYDAGVTDQGQPYLAIEYVEGQTITSYCDQQKMSLKGRLRLFLQVLGAVQYAHTNLVVHRDLKPANILVTNNGEARLLDFGIAKLLTEGEARETELTRAGGRALTPDYASPEQIAGDTITTASDVYSLGVILYELLTGARPYKLKRNTRHDLEAAILEVEPVKPSQATGDEGKAQARGVPVKRLNRGLKGDLDTIVLKALAKRPAERYASADAFAQDIERYLAGAPVLAQAESRWYRARKFVLRNKLAVGSAVTVIAALSLGLGIALQQARIARVQSRTAETTQAFLLDLFRTNSIAHPDPAQARRTTARELLDLGAKKIDGALNDAPEAKLKMLETLFRLYTDLGLQDPAVALGRSRVALAKSVYGPSHPEVARALVELAADSGESSYAKDRPALVNEAGAILDRNRDFSSPTRALYYLAMANVLVDTDLEKSGVYTAKAIKLYEQFPPSQELVASLNLLGQRQSMRDQFPEAAATLSKAASVANSLEGAARRPLPAIYAVLGEAQRQMLDFDGAERSMRLAVEMARTIKGEDNVDVLQTKWRLGNFLVQTSRPEEGLQLLKESLDLAIRTKGPDETFHTPMVRRAYGVNLLRYGRPEEAVPLFEQVVDVARRTKGANGQDFAVTLESYAPGEIELGHYGRAKELLEEAFALRAASTDKSFSRQLDDALLAQAKLLITTGKSDEAIAAVNKIPEKASTKITYSWLNVSLARAEAELGRNRTAAAIDQAAQVRKRIEDSGVARYFKRWEAQAGLLEGKALVLAGRSEEARPVLERALELGSEVYDHDRSPALADSQAALGMCLVELGRRDEARKLLLQAKAIHSSYKELGEHYRRPVRVLEARLVSRR